jgi:hypothetical protein|eukprot:3072428-Prymnesium_polylepis.2
MSAPPARSCATADLALFFPSLGLVTGVLRKCFGDLVSFILIFAITLLAFSQLFSMQLGSLIVGFQSASNAYITLVRGLFGDFDIDEVLAKSPGFSNILIFLVYLFVAGGRRVVEDAWWMVAVVGRGW